MSTRRGFMPNIKPVQRLVSEDMILTYFAIFPFQLPWQPELSLAMDSLKNLVRALPEEQPYLTSSR